MNIESTAYDLTHGWHHGFVLLYVLIAVFSLAGLKRARASFEQYFFWPFTAFVTMVVVGLSTEIVVWALGKFAGVRRDSFGANVIVVIVIMLGGYVGGLYWAARGRPLAAGQGRGAVVADGAAAQVATSKLLAKAKGQSRLCCHSRSPASRCRSRMRRSILN